MPDPQMPKSGLRAYGYEEDDLIPVGPDVAKDLFERDFSIYVLLPDVSASYKIKKTPRKKCSFVAERRKKG